MSLIYDKNTIWKDMNKQDLNVGDQVTVHDENGNPFRKATVRGMWMASRTEFTGEGRLRAMEVDRAEISSDKPYLESEIINTKRIIKI